MTVALINGLSYTFVSSTFKVAGVSCPSCTSVSINREQAKENNAGMSDKPVSRGRDFINITGSFEISLTDAEKIKAISPGRDILKLPLFEISFQTDNVVSVVKKILVGCDITNDGIETSQGDQDIKYTYNFVAADVIEI